MYIPFFPPIVSLAALHRASFCRVFAKTSALAMTLFSAPFFSYMIGLAFVFWAMNILK